MKTALELGRELEAKRGEFKAFLDERKTEAGLNFKGDDLVAFNERNDELAKMNDEYEQAKAIESAAKANDDALKSMKEIDRKVPFGKFDGDAEQQPDRSQGAMKSLGQLFVESAEFKSNAEKSPDVQRQWAAELPQGSMAIKASSYTTASGGTGTLPFPAPGRYAEFAARRPMMRQLVSVQDTSANGQVYASVQFIRENVQTLNADVVAEGALKPLTELGTERVTINLEAIAHRIKVPNQALLFIPGVMDRIDRKGTYGVQIGEENNMLNYNGSAGWKGFMVQSGVQTDAKGASDQFSAFHRGMTLIQTVAFAEVTGFAIHPNDWHEVITIKDTMGRFIYGDPSAMSPEVRLWGVPGISTVAATEGTPLMGDFAQDAVWWVAGGIRIIVGYENDDLSRNQQTIVIEEYGALEIDRPASFLKQSGW